MNRNKIPRIALVYDRVNKWGGAERLLLSLHRLYPQAPLYTLVYYPPNSAWADKIKIKSSFLNYLSPFRSHHEYLAPLAPLAFENFNFDSFDIVISLTSAEAKSIISKPQTLHLCYCLTPPRYLWGSQKDYPLPSFLRNSLRRTDLILSTRPDNYLAISKEVKGRLKKYYHQEAEVIYPPFDPIFKPGSILKPLSSRQYYLYVGRLVKYKQVDLLIKVFNKLGQKLIIAGTGREEKDLKKMASRNISFLGLVSDSELISLYQNARAVIFPQREDFGLVPLEAQACGTPVIAYAKGGALETIKDKQSGLFFQKQEILPIITAIKYFEAEKHQIKPANCLKNVAQFSQNRFFYQFSAKVETLWEQHQKTYT